MNAAQQPPRCDVHTPRDSWQQGFCALHPGHHGDHKLVLDNGCPYWSWPQAGADRGGR